MARLMVISSLSILIQDLKLQSAFSGETVVLSIGKPTVISVYQSPLGGGFSSPPWSFLYFETIAYQCLSALHLPKNTKLGQAVH